MKKITLLVMLTALFALSAFAQSKPNFVGEWSLDKDKSKLDERMSRGIESQTLTVTQTETELTTKTETKRAPRPEGGGGQGGQGGQGGGMRGGGGFGGGDSSNTYKLDGKETTVEIETPNGKMPIKLKGEIVDGKLKLQSSRTFNSPMGEVTMTTKESWELSADGKTLTVKRESESPRGTNSSELVYAKKN
jgi:hypothetical protein